MSAGADRKPGPRKPFGPGVPLGKAEKSQFAVGVVVKGRTSGDIQSACELAKKSESKVVFLTDGEYVFESTVNVPGGTVILGQGALTRCVSRDWKRTLFEIEGKGVRISRLCIEGPSKERDTKNDATGINVSGHENIRIDHCELLGLCRGVNFSGGSGQLDHSKIHHCIRDGLGYGISLYSGARVLIADNCFGQCRHALASNGALDWSSPKRVGKYVHKPGVRKTHWEFVHNLVDSNDSTQYELCMVDTHPGMDGTFVIEGNIFEKLRHAVGIRDGSGLIRWNVFRNFHGKSFRPWIGISIGAGKHNGIEVEGCMPRNIRIEANFFDKVKEHYKIGKAENVTIDGRIVPETATARREKAPPLGRLKPVGVEYAR
jgi:hypothetical protein